MSTTVHSTTTRTASASRPSPSNGSGLATSASNANQTPPDREPFDALRTWSESFADAQNVRIRLENRMRSGTVHTDMSAEVLDAQRYVEHKIGKAMVQSFRRAVPDIHRWTKATPGLGEPSMARLIGVIGHPVIARPHHWEGEGANRVLVADPPFVRNVAKLWAYCGHGDPERKKRKGMSADDAMRLGNPRAKMIIHLIAENAIKESGRKVDLLRVGEQQPEDAKRGYRRLYEETRLRYWIDHTEWSEGHQHNSALHLVAKEILRDLWLEAIVVSTSNAEAPPATPSGATPVLAPTTAQSIPSGPSSEPTSVTGGPRSYDTRPAPASSHTPILAPTTSRSTPSEHLQPHPLAPTNGRSIPESASSEPSSTPTNRS